MAKKPEKKQPVFVKTAIVLIGRDGQLKVFEAYPTVKKRILDGADFMEVTREDHKKVTLNKKVIESVFPID